jgi:hypothetical membrane protein
VATRDQSTSARAAGVLLALSGSIILMGTITAEALYPRAYSTAANTISDLGGTRPPEGLVLQPSAALFDATMLMAGVLVVIAAALAHRALGRWSLTVPLGVLGVGLLGVGLFPGNTTPHPLFAYVAFLGGGLAAVLSGQSVTTPMRHICRVLGAIALLATVLGTFLLSWGPVAELGEGGIERWIAYPVVLWLASFGGHLTASRSAPNQAELIDSIRASTSV